MIRLLLATVALSAICGLLAASVPCDAQSSQMAKPKPTLEQRVSRLEREVSELKRLLKNTSDSPPKDE